MRLAALYDIHGNLPALEAVLDDVRTSRVDAIVIGGDVCPGPMSHEVLARLGAVDLPVHYLSGNGDRVVLAARTGSSIDEVPAAYRDGVRWVADALSEEDVRRIGRWPATVRMAVDGLGAVLFCHATPRNDTDIFTRLTPESTLRPLFDAASAAVVVCGHTHMAFDRMVGPTRVVNAGSVGMPFGEPGAYWALLGPEVELRRTAYDLEAAAVRIRSTAYPQAEEFAARNVLQPPPESAILDAFSRIPLRQDAGPASLIARRRSSIAGGSDMSDESNRAWLRHTLATLAYRGGKAVRDVPEDVANRRLAPTSRTPLEIFAHVNDLLDWSLELCEGRHVFHESTPAPWSAERERFFAGLEALDRRLAAAAPLGFAPEQIFQGPIADALTHIGQIALVRRVAGAPVRGENYFRAHIAAGRVGPDQAAPVREFE